MPKVKPVTASGGKENDHLPFEQSKHLLRTKFYIPPIRPKQVTRPRLSTLIDGGLEHAVILVSAPAGYGKTTLISSWLNKKKIPSAWLSLDGSGIFCRCQVQERETGTDPLWRR